MSSSPPSNLTLNFHPDGTLFIVSGPSGAGKTTLINNVREELVSIGITLHFSVSHTTRNPRAGECEGINYYYVTPGEFDAMSGRGEFLEHAYVHEQQYGTSRSEVQIRLERGEDVILDIDYQGAKQIAEEPSLNERSLSVFIFPPSFEELESRLRARGVNTEQEIETRLRKAFAEIDAGKDFYQYIIINDNLRVATESLKAAIIAKKLQTKTALESIKLMAERFKEERDGRFT
jgi:guanylate kinase